MPELKTLLVNSPNISSGYATRKSSLTTRVTLNMRKCRRRSSDVGSIGQNSFVNEAVNSSCAPPDARHSICGSPALVGPSKSLDTNSGRTLEQISDEAYPTSTPAPNFMVSNDRLRSSLFNGKVNVKCCFFNLFLASTNYKYIFLFCAHHIANSIN